MTHNGETVPMGGTGVSGRCMVSDLTREQVSALLDYDAETGAFRWKASRQGCKPGRLAGFSNSHGYRQIGINGRVYLAHRLAWLITHGDWPELALDHINGDRADNRIANIRQATNSQNAQNIRAAKAHSTTGLLGVSKARNRRRYRAAIMVDGRRVYLGSFATAEEAHASYMRAKMHQHEFATQA